MRPMVTANATPMVTGGMADVMKDLKNRPTRMRIIRTVNTSMWEMSSMAPVSMS